MASLRLMVFSCLVSFILLLVHIHHTDASSCTNRCTDYCDGTRALTSTCRRCLLRHCSISRTYKRSPLYDLLRGNNFGDDFAELDIEDF